MNSYWQVLRTYLWRPRFWVLGFFYLLLVWGLFLENAWSGAFKGRGQASFSAMFTGLTGCFLALHVRRQFTNAAAQLVPGYATPHLVVAALISSLLWLIVPSAAILSGQWPPGALAFHACAAILMAVVVCWPRAIVLLVAVPALLIWQNRRYLPPGETPLLTLLLDGERPTLANMLFGAALLAQLVAGLMLLRMPRQGVTTNDEFSLDSTASVQDVNPLNRWFLAGRDAAAERLLEASAFASIQRWRVPVATSLAQLSIPAVFVLAAASIGLVAGKWQGWSTAATAMTCAVLLFVPLGPWHARRHAMSQEILLPVTRPRYFRQIILSMALDMALWMTVASALIAIVGIALFLSEESKFDLKHHLLIPAAIFLGLPWSMATFVFGVGLATMRWSLWLPIVAGSALVWFLGMLATLGTIHVASSRRHQDPFPELFVFVSLNVLIGLILALTTYRRWVRSDIA